MKVLMKEKYAVIVSLKRLLREYMGICSHNSFPGVIVTLKCLHEEMFKLLREIEGFLFSFNLLCTVQVYNT